jgi:hypothetical protein
VIVEAGVLGARQAQGGLPSALGQPSGIGPAVAGIGQRPLPVFAHAGRLGKWILYRIRPAGIKRVARQRKSVKSAK